MRAGAGLHRGGQRLQLDCGEVQGERVGDGGDEQALLLVLVFDVRLGENPPVAC
ncbi:hypothetical protein OG559_22510 [Micromonospora sp. NBC_01405]|uniref:hypothetical protein n=1 Tax=Micromonospora sp. NBC_01405 TaxID=2903589 RepID=UPI00324D3FD9